jgi:hypothetical protein
MQRFEGIMMSKPTKKELILTAIALLEFLYICTR